MDLSIVIVSWNTRELLAACVDSIFQTVDGLEYEVVVVDNNSGDGSATMITERFPQVRLLSNVENVGFACANNQAIRASSGRHILLLNSDAVLGKGAARQMVAYLDSHPPVGIVGGKLLNPDGSFQASYNDFPGLRDDFVELTGLSRWLLGPTYPSHQESQSLDRRQVDWVGGALLMARREAVEAFGLLDEGYFMYVEEMDWCYRAKQNGWTVVYLPEAEAIHWSGGSARTVPERKRAQLYRSKWLFLHKYYPFPRASAYRLLARATSYLKLLAWLPVRLSPDAGQRKYSRQQIASYRNLLLSL